MPKKPARPSEDDSEHKKPARKKKKKKDDAGTGRERPQRKHYNNFVNSLSERKQDRQMWGLFSWISRLRGGE